MLVDSFDRLRRNGGGFRSRLGTESESESENGGRADDNAGKEC
jgi:hypothetical protein